MVDVSTLPLFGRHALVTGAGTGIGRAIALRLAADGARVTLAGRRREPLEETAASMPPGSATIAADFDVTDDAAVERGLGIARGAFGPVDILVNNAGDAKSAPFRRMPMALWSEIVEVDLTAVFRVTQAVIADLEAHGAGARVVNVASTAGLVGFAYVAAYCAAKHGVIGLTRALAVELARTGITVNAVCPGYTDTPLARKAVADIVAKTGKAEAEVIGELTAGNPQRRLVDPAEVADAVGWLVSPGASSINGQAIVIAGGEVMVG